MIPTFYGTTQIDHIVFSQYGIFVIETKNYKGWIFGSFNGESWQQTLYKEKHFFRNPHLQNIGHIKALRHLLINPRQTLFVPIVVFTGDAVLKLHSDIRQNVLYEDELVDKIRSFREPVMSESAALRFSKLLVLKEIVGEKRTTEHICYAESVEAKSQNRMRQGLCPRCGARLVLRNGPYGRFYGCSNYPRCRFTEKA